MVEYTKKILKSLVSLEFSGTVLVTHFLLPEDGLSQWYSSKCLTKIKQTNE